MLQDVGEALLNENTPEVLVHCPLVCHSLAMLPLQDRLNPDISVRYFVCTELLSPLLSSYTSHQIL